MDILKYITIEAINHYVGDYLVQKPSINNITINSDIISLNNIEFAVNEINKLEVVQNLIQLFNFQFKSISISKIRFNTEYLKKVPILKKFKFPFCRDMKQSVNIEKEMVYLDNLVIVLDFKDYFESLMIDLSNISDMSIDNLRDYAFEKIKNDNSKIFGNDEIIINKLSYLLENIIFNIEVKVKNLKLICKSNYYPPIEIYTPLILLNNLQSNSKIKQLKTNIIHVTSPFNLQSLMNISDFKLKIELKKRWLDEQDLNESSYLDLKESSIQLTSRMEVGNIFIKLDSNDIMKFLTINNTINNLENLKSSSILSSIKKSSIFSSKMMQNAKLVRIKKKFINYYRAKLKFLLHSVGIVIDQDLAVLSILNITGIIDDDLQLFIDKIKINIIDNLFDKLKSDCIVQKLTMDKINFIDNYLSPANTKSHIKNRSSLLECWQNKKFNNNNTLTDPFWYKILTNFNIIKIKISNGIFEVANSESDKFILKIHNLKLQATKNIPTNLCVVRKTYDSEFIKCILSLTDFEIIDGIKKSKWNKMLCRDVTRKGNKYLLYISTKISRNNTNFDFQLNFKVNPLRLFINQYSLFYLISVIQKVRKSTSNSDFNYTIKSLNCSEVSLLIDYRPIRFNIQNVWDSQYSELLNIFPLQNLHITLKSIKITEQERMRVLCYWKNKWTEDVLNKISLKYLSSIIMINSLVTIMTGFLDIFTVPYE